MKRKLFIIIAFPLQEKLLESDKPLQTLGDVFQFALPAGIFIYSLVQKDWETMRLGSVSGVKTVVLSYLLKYALTALRPSGSRTNSFPSARTSSTFYGSTYFALKEHPRL